MRKGGCSSQQGGMKRGAWTGEEDKILSDYIANNGIGRWRSLPTNAGLNRCGKSCRLRWLNYLRPDIKRGNITEEEEELIVRLHKLLGNRWSLIAGRLPGRTDNEIKNYWNTYLRKKVMGESSEQQSSSRSRKTSSDQNPSTEKIEKPGVNVIRTKATRRTRAAASTDQIPNSDDKNASDAPQLPLEFNEQNSYPEAMNMSKDDTWITEIMQSPLLPGMLRHGSFSSTEDMQNIGYSDISLNQDKYVRGLLNNGYKDSEGIYSFLGHDSWEALVMPGKIFGC